MFRCKMVDSSQISQNVGSPVQTKQVVVALQHLMIHVNRK